MADDLETNLETEESSLLSVDPRKRWRLAGAAIIAFPRARSNVHKKSPELELELTSLSTNLTRLRVAYIMLRSIAAFSRARDAAIAEIRDELQNPLLGNSQSDHTTINIEQNSLISKQLPQFGSHVERERLCNVVRTRNREQLRQFGDVRGIASALLETDTENGIQGDHESIAHRQQIFGSNIIIEKPPPHVKQIVWETIKDPIIIILLICAILSLVFGTIKHGWKGWPNGGGIFAAVFVVVAVIAYCKIWTRRQIFNLVKAGDYFNIDVMRNGKMDQIFGLEVVVGDVICLKQGDQVPADGLYVHGDSLQVESSNFKEEIESPKLKDSNDPFLFSGSRVTSGSARMLVTAVGMSTSQWQMLRKHCCDTNDQITPLEMKLHKLAMIIAKVGLVVAFLVLLVLLIRYFTGKMHDDHGKTEFLKGKTRIHQVCFAVIGILATPLAIASTAIPEGLMLAVIIPIAYSTYTMAEVRKALARNLSVWEEIASITEICTDERGNLTGQKWKVGRFWCVRELLHQGVVSDNTEVSARSSAALREWASASQSMTGDAEGIRANCTILHQKCDPEGMLAKCSQYYDEHGNIKEITSEVREILKQKIHEMKSKFPQCIGFSCLAVSEDDKNDNENIHPHQKEEFFTLIGVVGLIYSCPPEINEAVSDCQSAGVNVILLTRSELPAARVIAFECGILDHPNEDKTTGQVVDGHDFLNYPKENRLKISDKIRVMARATTMARRHLVEDLKEIGHVVAVTGDSIAKGNSDITVLIDGFEPTAKLLRWARSVYYKILTYMHFQLTVTISSLVVDFVTAISASEPPNIKVVATISSGKAPVAALQVLWAKLIVGVLAALAITIEEPPKKLQELPPFKKTEQILANILWKNIVGQALYPIIILLTITFKGESVFSMDPKVKDTMIFNIFVLWQLSIIFSTKRFEINIIKWFQREKLFWTIVGSIVLVQVVFVEKLEEFAGTKRLNWKQWAECIGVAVLAWPIRWLVKRINISAPAVYCTYI